MRHPGVLTGAGVLAAGVIAVGVLTGGTHTQRQPEDVDIADGEALYQAHCAACHGARLEGQENWQTASGDGPPPAPPHDASGHTWHHGDDLLFTYTKLGGAETLARQGVQFESGMPGFGEDLSDRDIWNILAFIKSTWPQRVKEVQAARTAAE